MALGVRSVQQRAMSKFQVGDGCWQWTASLSSSGYGQIASGGAAGRPLAAHRVIYELLVGPIPDELYLDHLCRNRGCVNPAHMEPVTHAENVRRGVAGDTHRRRMAELTHCKHGHEFTPENTSWGRNSNGRPRRRCLACHANRERARRRGWVR